MSEMKTKNIIMIGLVLGLGLLFVGAMISNVFPTTESDLFGYRLSSFVKMLGLGFITSSMVIGGIVVEHIDKNLKLLLLLLGLIILVIYTIGAHQLNWQITSLEDEPLPQEAYEDRPTGYGVAGFETLSLLVAMIFTVWIVRIKQKNH